MTWNKWYYIKIKMGKIESITSGPSAIPYNRKEEHWDMNHVHIKAFSKGHARIRALGIIHRELS